MKICHWPSPGKVNLFLYIGHRRCDGYHSLQTLLQFLDYGDIITIITNKTGRINLFTSTFFIKNKDNLIFKAAKMLQMYCWPNGYAPGADIILNKILPIGGGVGGGSSNAATTLIVLNYLWKCNLKLKTLNYLGTKLGTDIPFFIYGYTSIVESIGELLTPIDFPERWYLIIIPDVHVSTEKIFNTPMLKRNSIYLSMKNLLNKPFHNDCELIVKKKFSCINEYFLWFAEHTNLIPRLTGTGSCMFLDFDNKNNAKYIQSLLPSWMKNFIAKGVNVSPLHRILFDI